MDSHEVHHDVESEEQFWAGLDDIVAGPSETHELIDNSLRSFLALITTFKQEYLQSEYDFARCCYRLLDAPLFTLHEDYVRRQIVYCLLQEDEADTLHLAAALLLFDGRAHETTFEMMRDENSFPRLVELIQNKRDNASRLHRLLLELLFELSRMQKLSRDDLAVVDDNFILHLFALIEESSDDADDPYHYPTIRVLLILNEQYMCHANVSSSHGGPPALTNRVLKLLSLHGPSYRTFGENIILLLNRETGLASQLLILKLLYLLFTTPSTYEYFYTNDLHVLVDVIIRNLLDLDPGNVNMGLAPDGSEKDGHLALRHTYLRVLCPLLKNTQLAREGNNYKRSEVRKLLYVLVNRSSAHFAPVDETVIRLVIRCKQIEWLREEGDEQDQAIEEKLVEVAPTESAVAKKLLGMSIADAAESSLSIVDMSARVTKEKPSVPAPRRRRGNPKPIGNGKASHANKTFEREHLTVPVTVATRPPFEDAIQNGIKSPFADEDS